MPRLRSPPDHSCVCACLFMCVICVHGVHDVRICVHGSFCGLYDHEHRDVLMNTQKGIKTAMYCSHCRSRNTIYCGVPF